MKDAAKAAKAGKMERSEQQLLPAVLSLSLRLTLRLTLRLLLSLSLLLSSGCTTIFAPGAGQIESAQLDTSLINAVVLFGPPPATPPVRFPDPDEVLALTPEIHSFARRQDHAGTSSLKKARRLVRAMIAQNFFAEGYYTDDTLTATELFATRSGNCLSYTNLYVAMARAIGLEARFQLARIPAAWSSDSGYLVRSRHINVQIRDTNIPAKDWLTVDFNRVATSSFYPHQVVSDEYALSSFYNNIAVDYLYAGDHRATVALLAKALETDPNNADAWINLAAVYSRHSRPIEAKAAFAEALRAEPGNESAAAGMIRLLKAAGDTVEAARYEEESRLRRERDPYFHFAMAQAAYDQRDLEQSLLHVNRAIEMRASVGPFYYLRGLVQYAQGELSAASASLAKAQQRKRSLSSRKQQHALALANRINERWAAEQGL